jgi:hypothetical protein
MQAQRFIADLSRQVAIINEDSLNGISLMLGDVAAMPDFLTKAVVYSQPSNIQIQKTGAEAWFNAKNQSPLLIWSVSCTGNCQER